MRHAIREGDLATREVARDAAPQPLINHGLEECQQRPQGRKATEFRDTQPLRQDQHIDRVGSLDRNLRDDQVAAIFDYAASRGIQRSPMEP